MEFKFYQETRKNLINSIDDKKTFLLVSSGYPICRSKDENYNFQVNTNFYYLTGIKQPETMLIIVKDNDSYKEMLFIDPYDELHEKWIGHRLTKDEASQISGINVNDIYEKNELDSILSNLISNNKLAYLDLENNNNYNNNSYGLSMVDTFFSKNKKIVINDVNKNITVLRMSKKQCEVDILSKAINATKVGLENVMGHLKPGLFEYQVESFFDQAIKYEGCLKHAFTTIAAAGVNATTLHYSNNDTKIKDGDLVLFDLGAAYEEYHADVTRTYPANGKFTSKQKEIYEIVLNANKKIAEVARAGMKLSDLQQICKDTLAEGCMKIGLIKTKEELDKYYFHGVSHSIGLDTHDPFDRNLPMPEGTIISDEPGLYIKELGIGIRIEDDLLVLKDKAIVLTKDIIKEIDEIEKFMEDHHE